MIPKTIHYCWFGRNPKPKLPQKCIRSWKTCCPDYRIVEWNEGNYDLDSAPLYVRQAYHAKKWAFVTDYVRLQIVYEQGGIYLDTDVEMIRSLDRLLQNHVYFGFETDQTVNTGLGFGAEKGAEVLLDLMKAYEDLPFISSDGRYDVTPCPERNTAVLRAKGLRADGSEQILDGGIHIYPKPFFCPKDYESGETVITEDTYTIHHFNASWHTPFEKFLHIKERRFIQKFGAMDGAEKMRTWKHRHRVLVVLFLEGPESLIRKAAKKLSLHRR
ncbi:MAG: glycosyl transferase [Oscillospiraceae bacterium]|nr:glycosyl transferase [Oscillospiraceae bacterium]